MLITNVIVYLGMIKKDRCMLQGFVFLALLLNTLFVNATPVQLSCEHLVNPVGIDAAHPRFSWQLIDNDKGATQTAYQLMIGTDPNKLSFWDSKKINAGAQLITYNGKALQPFTKYYWAVKVWNKAGRESMSAIAFFETGMMSMENWKGSWVTDTKDINLKQAAYFRKTFISSKKITSARAYIAAAGLYELSVNGNRIGDHRLDPMYTRFDRRTLYVTYDVTKQLQDGKNTVGILMGNGWYNHQSTAVWYFDKAPWRARPSFCVDLRISYADGSVETIASGNDWTTMLSPVMLNSIYTAEHYDARMEIPHWDEPSFIDTAWKKVIYASAPSQNIVAQAMVPIRNTEKIPAADLKVFADTDYVFNLGRNISGVSSISFSGERGTIIRLKHGERLYSNGHVDQSNIDVHYRPVGNSDPFQTDIYILKGVGTESFTPRFNYKGFQYVEVSSNKPIQLNQESLTAFFMHSDVPPMGTLNCSNEIINKIWSATNNSYLSNLFGYPTDCPQREKNGWTGDAQIAIETGLYNFDAITVYEKWLADLRDEQQPNGVLPAIVPTGGWGYEWANGLDWTSAIAVIPWNLYLFYGDSKPLADNYEAIKKYVDHVNDKYPTGLTDWGLGDWIPVKSVSPVELTSTCYYYADANILAQTAKLFGKSEDYKKYQALASKIKNAFNQKYLDTTKGIYGSGLQTELCVPLFWGLVPENFKPKVAGSLAKRIIADGTQLDVGLLGTKAILNALSENGYPALAYQLASRESFPSWGWWIKNGATTLYENWPIDANSDLSMNHIMFGEIGAWLYKALGGIKPDPMAPGFKNILLQPYFNAGPDSVSCSHDGPYGKIISAWKKAGDYIVYDVTIPPGSTATLLLPHQKPQSLASGTYHFTIKNEQ
jgi:alpha-L-rhamnosidase